MKKIIVLILAALLLLPVLPVYGSEEDVIMRIVSCPEQGFATVCKPEYSYDYTPDGGLTIYLGESGSEDKITIFKTDAPGGDFQAETYFNNAYLNMLTNSYGDSLLDPGEYLVYEFADREMPGRMVLYEKDGNGRMRFCLYDLQEDYFVRYEAYFASDESEMQDVINDLSIAIRYFQPDPDYYSTGNDAVEEQSDPRLNRSPLSAYAKGNE